MDQMADEMTLGVDMKEKGRVNTAEESSTWVRGERLQSEAEVSNLRLEAPSDTRPGETTVEDPQRLRQRDSSTSPLLSIKTYLRRSSSAESSTTDSLSSSRQSSMGVDCAGLVLNCLFCRFHDMIHMLPGCCESAAHHCCPNYKQVITTVESAPSGNEDSWIDFDCGLFSACQDTSECLEFAMEISELCYR